jgi:uncharacterized RDD family membrane protein YckC
MYSQEETPIENYSGQKDLLQHEIPVFTNENYAGFWLRFAAILIDGIVMMVVVTIFSMIVGLKMLALEEPEEAMAGVLGFYGLFQIVVILYFSLMESSNLQATLGKKAVGVYVTDLNGQKISFGRALGRYFGKILSGLIIYIGFIMAGFTEKKQGLHDILAGTLVLKGNKG